MAEASINAEMHGIKIRKLKLRPSAGKVFYRVYEKGNPQHIPQIKEEVRNALSQFSGDSCLVYRVLKDRIVFLGKVSGEVPQGKIGTAIVSEISVKIKKIIFEVVEREMSGGGMFIQRSRKEKFSGEVHEISKKDAAREIGVAAGDFQENAVSGEVYFTALEFQRNLEFTPHKGNGRVTSDG